MSDRIIIDNLNIRKGGQTFNILLKGKPLPKKPFSEITNSELAQLLDAYYAGVINLNYFTDTLGWKVGDTRTFKHSAVSNFSGSAIGEENRPFTILGFEHDELENPIGERTKALLTLAEFSSFTGPYHTSYTTINYNGCRRRQFFNNEYFESFELKNLIKNIKKKYNSFSTAVYNEIDKLFVLSLIEVYKNGARPGYSVVNDGVTYKYWEDKDYITTEYYIIKGTRTTMITAGYYVFYVAGYGHFDWARTGVDTSSFYYGFCL